MDPFSMLAGGNPAMAAGAGALQAVGGGPSSAESGGEAAFGDMHFNFAPPAHVQQAQAQMNIAPWLVIGVVVVLVFLVRK